MNNLKRFLIGTAASVSLLANSVLPAGAAYTLFGSATTVGGGNPGNAIQTVSNTSTVDTADDFGGISIDDANGSFISGLTQLSTDYNVTDDNCGGGSPRFSIRVDSDNDNVASEGDKRVFVYLGAHPNYNTCTPNTWTASGNLVSAVNPVWDTSQVGGTFYDTYANASTLTSANEILGISLVTDAGWSQGDGEQTVLFDNVTVNSNVETFEPETYTVTIEKYIDGNKATALSANNSAFSMTATWNATNIGAGSGNYDLDADGFNGNPTPYQAITSEMTAGADYSTNEVTGGSVVGASCSTGQPFALVGYSTGNSLSEAENGTKSLTIPSFTNLQSDKYVIVWNMTCPVTPPGPEIPEQCAQDVEYNVIEGTGASEVINGTNGPDLIFARGGSDVVNGKDGNDCIVGGAGSDVLHGQQGDDVILGGADSDSINGHNGNDKLYGQDGSDSVMGGGGNDQLFGGAESDYLNGGGNTDTATGNAGSDACTAETEVSCEA